MRSCENRFSLLLLDLVFNKANIITTWECASYSAFDTISEAFSSMNVDVRCEKDKPVSMPPFRIVGHVFLAFKLIDCLVNFGDVSFVDTPGWTALLTTILFLHYPSPRLFFEPPNNIFIVHHLIIVPVRWARYDFGKKLILDNHSFGVHFRIITILTVVW